MSSFNLQILSDFFYNKKISQFFIHLLIQYIFIHLPYGEGDGDNQLQHSQF